MQISKKASLAGAIVPIVLAGTCLACAPLTAWAEATLDADSATAAAVAKMDEGDDVLVDGVMTYAGLQMTLPDDMKARGVVGTLVNAASSNGQIAASIQDISLATLPEDGDLETAFMQAASNQVAGYTVSSVTVQGTVDLGGGATGYVYEFEAAGPYTGVLSADGTMDESEVDSDSKWTIRQVYVVFADGGMALVQVSVSDSAGAEFQAAAQEAIDSLTVVDDGRGVDVPGTRVSAGEFTFVLPEGLSEVVEDRVWLGDTYNVLVEATDMIVWPDDAVDLKAEDYDDIFESAARGIGATYEGSATMTTDDGAEVVMGTFLLNEEGEGYSFCMVLVPVADGTIEGLTFLLDSEAATAWGDTIDGIVQSISITHGADATGEAQDNADGESDLDFLAYATKTSTQAIAHGETGRLRASVGENTMTDFTSSAVSAALGALDSAE